MTFPDNDLRRIMLTQFTKNDLLIAFSYSGKKSETLRLAETAFERSVPVLSVTGIGVSPLSQLATVSLEVAAFEENFRTSALSSRIASLYVVDVLYYTYALCFCDSPIDKLQTTYDTVNTKQKRPLEENEAEPLKRRI
jgi:DNA-binding MurR/RpiR family transcriptional regulator